jgi:hypothetical protein
MSDEEGVIERTALLVDQLGKENQRELERRYARRNRLRYLDQLLARFESLNMRGVEHPPLVLTHDVCRMAIENRHPLRYRPLDGMSNANWMDVVYELQDPWLLPADDRYE